MTPTQFEALRRRREVEFRYQCAATAIVAADGRNKHRTQSSDRIWEALDFVSCEEEIDPRREEVKRNIAAALGMRMHSRPFLPGSVTEHMPLTTQEMSDWRRKIVRDLREQGFEDPDAIFDEALEK